MNLHGETLNFCCVAFAETWYITIVLNIPELCSRGKSASIFTANFVINVTFLLLLLAEPHPPIDDVIRCEVIPRFIYFLQRNDNSMLQVGYFKGRVFLFGIECVISRAETSWF